MKSKLLFAIFWNENSIFLVFCWIFFACPFILMVGNLKSKKLRSKPKKDRNIQKSFSNYLYLLRMFLKLDSNFLLFWLILSRDSRQIGYPTKLSSKTDKDSCKAIILQKNNPNKIWSNPPLVFLEEMPLPFENANIYLVGNVLCA